MLKIPAKRIALCLVAIYLFIGLIFATEYLYKEYQTFECRQSADEIIISTGRPWPPLKNCHRKISSDNIIPTALTILFLWLPLAVGKGWALAVNIY